MDGVESVRALPLWAGFPLAILAVIVATIQARKTEDGATRFIIFALTLRIILSGMHDLTFKSSPLGLSWNALATILVAGSGLLVIRRKVGFSLIVGAATPLLLVMLISTLINATFASGLSAIAKTCYFVVLATLVAQSAKAITPSRLCALLLPIMILPLIYQIVAIPLGVVKAGESDGSASYIGGFNHEAGFSVLLLASLTVTCFADTLKVSAKTGMIAWCLVALFLANYRTSIVAVGPLVLTSVFYMFVGAFHPRQRILMGVMVFGSLIAAFLIVVILAGDRFSDLGTALSYGTDIIQRPGTVTEEYRRLLSGRPAIWSEYVYGWVDADLIRKAVGFGPESWTQYFGFYAHNTLASALFEEGVLGFGATVILWIINLLIATRTASRSDRLRLVAAQFSFFILNMATMPMWMIEGMIFYALMVGLSVYYAKARLIDKRRVSFPATRFQQTVSAG